jgi:antitoxin component of MazEF toxin-antitoxin module
MQTKIQKWVNSQGIRIPKNLLLSAHLNVGGEVEFQLIFLMRRNFYAYNKA